VTRNPKPDTHMADATVLPQPAVTMGDVRMLNSCHQRLI